MNIDLKIRQWAAEKQGPPDNADPLAGAFGNAPSVPPRLPVTTDPLSGAMSPVRPPEPQQEPRAIRRFRERLAALREDLAQQPESTDGMSERRTARAVEDLIALVQKAQRLMRDIDEEDGVAGDQLLGQTTELRDEMRARLYEIVAAFLNTTALRRSTIRDARRWIEANLPLSDEQRAELNEILDRRLAELEAADMPEAQYQYEPYIYGEVPLSSGIVFMSRDEETEAAAIAVLREDWLALNEAGSRFMENALQLLGSCGTDTQRSFMGVMEEARQDAMDAMTAARVVESVVPPERLAELGLVLPTEANVTGVPQGVDICNGHGTMSEDVSYVFINTGDLAEAERPATLTEFGDAIKAVGERAFEDFINTMLEAGYAANPDSVIYVDLQLYIGEDGRIRTIVASYPPPHEEDVIFMALAQDIADDISRTVAAPLLMRYHRARLQFTVLDANRIRTDVY